VDARTGAESNCSYLPTSRRSVIDVYWSVNRTITVVETEEFLDNVQGVLSEDEHDLLILFFAQQPEVGVPMPGTGGLRKLRWASKGRGKRGGSRVIYYFHNIDVPLFLMAILREERAG